MVRGEFQDADAVQILSLLSRGFLHPVQLAATIGWDDEKAWTLWRAANGVRRLQGLPFISDANGGNAGASVAVLYEQPVVRGWYAHTWRLAGLLERFQTNESLAGHYDTVLHDPEGGHFVLSLAASEIAAILCPEYRLADDERIRSVVVGATEPRDDVERVAANVGSLLIDIGGYRDEPVSPELVERIYARLLDGVEMPEPTSEDLERRSNRLAALSDILSGTCKADDRDAMDGAQLRNPAHHAVIGAIAAFLLIDSAGVFPTMNRVLAYVVYFLALHRAGYHVCSHVPAISALLAGDDRADTRNLPARLVDRGLVVHCGEHFEWTGYLETVVERLVGEQLYIMTKLDGMARRRARIRSILAADETMNWRQRDVLLEAILHSNAEFSYAVHEERYKVSYLCARSDFLRLLDLGFLQKCSDGIRHFFIAAENLPQLARTYLRRQCPTDYALYYTDDGALRSEHRATVDAASSFNQQVSFYERELVEGTYIEHQSSRRAPMAVEDGPRRHDKIDLGGRAHWHAGEEDGREQALGSMEE